MTNVTRFRCVMCREGAAGRVAPGLIRSPLARLAAVHLARHGQGQERDEGDDDEQSEPARDTA